jgi:hypothetical protein
VNIKHTDDYIDELSVYFPQIEKKELRRMVNKMTSLLSSYMRDWYRGFSIRSKNSLVGDGRFNRFRVERIFGKHHLNSMKKASKKYNKKNGTRT